MTTQYDELFTDDKLNIQPYVIDFAHLIEQEIQTSKVYSIDAEFGIGKTFFCDHLESVLKKDKIRVVKLNIWEMDFYEDPLMPILSELNELYKINGETLPTKILNIGKTMSKKALTAIAEGAIKVTSAYMASKITQATGDVINPEDINPLNCIQNQCDSDSIYTEFQTYKESLTELKDCLSKWVKKDSRPIVMIIDELDRCKPDYAVRTLETLKHFFNIPGFVFVIAIDGKQLENSVKTLFGTTNFDGYKRKFINNTFFLPNPNREAFAEFLYGKSGISNIIKKIQDDRKELVFKINIYDVYCCTYQYSYNHNLNRTTQPTAEEFNRQQTSEMIIKRYFAAYSGWFNFTLRQMEQVFDRLILFIKQISVSNELFSPDLAVFLVCLHEFDIKIYNRLKSEPGPIDGSVLHRLVGTGVTSFAYQIYGEKYMEKFGRLNRKLIPTIPMQETYSSKLGSSKQEITDNIDRFFVSEPETWLIESRALKTNGVLRSETRFNAKKFRGCYFKHMDFIEHFEHNQN